MVVHGIFMALVGCSWLFTGFYARMTKYLVHNYIAGQNLLQSSEVTNHNAQKKIKNPFKTVTVLSEQLIWRKKPKISKIVYEQQYPIGAERRRHKERH